MTCLRFPCHFLPISTISHHLQLRIPLPHFPSASPASTVHRCFKFSSVVSSSGVSSFSGALKFQLLTACVGFLEQMLMNGTWKDNSLLPVSNDRRRFQRELCSVLLFLESLPLIFLMCLFSHKVMFTSSLLTRCEYLKRVPHVAREVPRKTCARIVQFLNLIITYFSCWPPQ